MEALEDAYSELGVRDKNVTAVVDDAARAVVAAERMQESIIQRLAGSDGSVKATGDGTYSFASPTRNSSKSQLLANMSSELANQFVALTVEATTHVQRAELEIQHVSAAVLL